MLPHNFSISHYPLGMSLIILLLAGTTVFLAAVLGVSPVLAGDAEQSNAVWFQAESRAADIEAEPAQMREQPTFYMTGVLSAGQVQRLTVPVEAATTASFLIVAQQPVSMTLVDPAGAVIDPSTPSTDPEVFYDVMQPGAEDSYPLWYYQYTVASPAEGLWQVQLAAATETQFEMVAEVESQLQFIVLADEGTYSPGEAVTLEGGIIAAERLQAGYTLSGTMQMPDGSSFPLSFHDDGAGGDKNAGDNLQTAQFLAPGANGDIEILVQASKDNIVRYTSLLVAVVSQTATIQGAGPESAVDANGNG